MTVRPADEWQRLEYLAIVGDRFKYKRYGSNACDVKWAEEALARLQARPFHLGYRESDRADVDRIKSIFGKVWAKAGFNPGQPREDNGRWSGGGASGTWDDGAARSWDSNPDVIQPVGNPLTDAIGEP